jgi:N-acetylglucosaminyldiphosphoundecaprenol N-acetyl-beta-D-mannosaminyltransferase
MNDGGRVSVMGMPVDALGEPVAIAAIMDQLARGQGGSVITAHLEILRQYRKNPELRPLFESADLIVADGQPLVWASRLQGTPLPERVAGSDIVWSLVAECALRGLSVYLIGGSPGACEAAMERLHVAYPAGMKVDGCCPPMGFENDEGYMRQLRQDLAAARPDIVLVGLGFPKQERLITVLRETLPSAWFVGVGVSFSFIAGHVQRAPDWMMRAGLEWVHRLAQEPRRLAARYLVHGIPFGMRLMAHALYSRVVRRGRPAPPSRLRVSEAARSQRLVFHHGALERRRFRELAEALEIERERLAPEALGLGAQIAADPSRPRDQLAPEPTASGS